MVQYILENMYTARSKHSVNRITPIGQGMIVETTQALFPFDEIIISFLYGFAVLVS